MARLVVADLPHQDGLRQTSHPNLRLDWLSEIIAPVRRAARYRSAELAWAGAIAFSNNELGSDHPDTATSYNNVASNLNAQGRYEEAEPLFRRAIEVFERVLGVDHPNTRVVRGNWEAFKTRNGK